MRFILGGFAGLGMLVYGLAIGILGGGVAAVVAVPLSVVLFGDRPAVQGAVAVICLAGGVLFALLLGGSTAADVARKN